MIATERKILKNYIETKEALYKKLREHRNGQN
jgi:hypothetical protein